VANAVGGVINLSRRAKSAAVANEVVSFPADTSAINISFISIASRDTKAEILDVSFVAYTRFCDGVVGGVENTS